MRASENQPERNGVGWARRIRIVTVGDYDACPCIGRHVGRTGEIGGFRIISADHADGVLRLRFVVASAEEQR